MWDCAPALIRRMLGAGHSSLPDRCNTILSQGLVAVSDFSGAGFAESAVTLVAAAWQQVSDSAGCVPCLWRSSDILMASRRVLCASSEFGPQHVFGDVTKRVRQGCRKQLLTFGARAAQAVQSHVDNG
eukprot:1676118-Alexandrium_andersonii.AAC.1